MSTPDADADAEPRRRLKLWWLWLFGLGLAWAMVQQARKSTCGPGGICPPDELPGAAEQWSDPPSAPASP